MDLVRSIAAFVVGSTGTANEPALVDPATGRKVQVEAMCSPDAFAYVDNLRRCSSTRDSYFRAREEYAACIEETCGPRPRIAPASEVQAWQACVAERTGWGSCFVGSPNGCEVPPDDGPRQEAKGGVCLRESNADFNAALKEPSLLSMMFSERESFDACIRKHCGPRPSDGATKAWNACAALNTKERPGEDGSSEAKVPVAKTEEAEQLLPSEDGGGLFQDHSWLRRMDTFNFQAYCSAFEVLRQWGGEQVCAQLDPSGGEATFANLRRKKHGDGRIRVEGLGTGQGEEESPTYRSLTEDGEVLLSQGEQVTSVGKVDPRIAELFIAGAFGIEEMTNPRIMDAGLVEGLSELFHLCMTDQQGCLSSRTARMVRRLADRWFQDE